MNLRLDTAFDASSVPFGSAISAMLSYLSFKPDFHFGLRESTELVAPLFLNSYPNRNRRRMLTRAACGGASPPSTIAGQGHKLRKQPPEAKHGQVSCCGRGTSACHTGGAAYTGASIEATRTSFLFTNS